MLGIRELPPLQLAAAADAFLAGASDSVREASKRGVGVGGTQLVSSSSERDGEAARTSSSLGGAAAFVPGTAGAFGADANLAPAAAALALSVTAGPFPGSAFFAFPATSRQASSAAAISGPLAYRCAG